MCIRLEPEGARSIIQRRPCPVHLVEGTIIESCLKGVDVRFHHKRVHSRRGAR
jgi:hypothetical protein